jgi:hypothetical protein
MLQKYWLPSVVVHTRMNDDCYERIRQNWPDLLQRIQPDSVLLAELKQFPTQFHDLALRDIWVNVLFVVACYSFVLC